ncbi:uncharacterized protein LOC143204885 isoform X6 [Rhynchophorus ferrugineus]|uniref:uncharacterized protein LOC143204885 isoform X6 n=1 Tax=Rhynchophorus ferrugineus TaxID=354439 RepID=UPI003FCC2E87
MKLLFVFLLFVCLVEIYGQRSRTTNQESNKDDPPKPVRGRGRARFTSAQESNPSAEITTRATSNRRASTRTRIHSNNPKAAADRRAQSTDSPKQYAVHEPNNESPIDSFRRQSKSRVLTENRFDTTSFARRPTTFESSRTSVTPPLTNELPVEVLSQDFGSTARAILQARGETPPPKTTSPRVDQEYLLNNFGSTIRSLAASRSASRGEGPSQRSAALRSENSVPSRRASLKTSLDREPLTRARGDKSLDRSKSESHKSTTEASSFDNLDSVFQAERETEGISEQNDLTETQPFEVSSETVPIETEEFRKTSSVEVSTQKTTEVSEIRRAGNVRRVGVRSKAAVSAEAPSNPAPRVRASRTRSRVDIDTAATVPRGRSSKRQDDVSVAESRKGPSVFMAESTSEVPSRPRPGRRIDNRYEGVPQRVTIDLPTTIRTRVGGRRASVAEVAPTEKSSVRTNTRGRSKSATKSTEPSTNSAPIPIVRSRSDSGDISPSYTRSSNRRSSSVEVQSAPTRNENTRANRPSGRRQSVTENIYQRTSVEVTTPIIPVVQDSSYGARTGRSRIETTTASVSYTSPTGRIRGRFSDGAPKIDESKLEVLPLFEREPKADSSIRSRGQRSRTSISRRQGFAEDRMQVSATEDDVKFVDKPTTAFTRVTVTRTESVEASTSRARLSTRMVSSSTSTTSKVSSSTKSTPTTKRTTTTTTASPTTKKVVPVIKESVVAEVNAVTSKSTITRRKKVVKPTKVSETAARGSKKSEVKLSDLSVKKNGEDEVDEEDNYPEAFKALIQAKKQEESRSSKPSSTRGASTSTEKVFVTSSAPSRSSPVNRIVTTSLPAVSRMPQLVSEIVNESDNELDPKSGSVSTTTTRPTRSRLMPKFSDKTKFNPKSKDRVPKTTTEKPRTTSGEKTLKATSFPRKSFTPKGYSTKAPHEHHLRKKALRSTSFPPATTPIPIARESKFSAKFIRKSEAENAEKNEKRPKGFFSNRKKQNGEEQSRRKLDETTPIPPKKPTSSLFSSRYRSDLPPKTTVLKMATTKPYYVPTIPTPAYIPTIPTLKPSFGQVDQDYVVEKDKDLGIEVISFDEPVNAIPSADLVNGEYLAADKTARLSATVKDGTTEKPISIIERIINSITSISTTAIPDTINLSSSTTTEATENSAILKLAPKKPTTKDKTKLDDKTNTFETLTSEKPTTLIEKILSSLSAIQSNEVDSNREGRLLAVEQTPTVSGSTTRVLSSGMLNDISSRSQTGANVLQSMNSVKDVVSSTTAPSSTTTVSSTTSTTTPSTTSSTSSTTVMNIVEIIAVPGETRISKSQTTTVPQTTTDAPSTTKRSVTETSTVVPTTTVASAATTNNPQANIVETTIVPELPGSQSSEAIPSTLGEILNDRTVDALNNLISSDVKTTTEAPNFKTLNVNQNSVETTTTSSSSNDAPFTSPVLLSESATQIPTPSDALIASTSASTLIPVITQDTEITTPVIVTTTPPTTMSQTTTPSAATTAPFTISKTETTTPELQTTTEKVVIVTATSQIPVTQEASTAPESTTLLSSIITTLFPNLLKVTTTESSLATPFTSPVLSTTIDNRVEILSTAGTTAQPSTVLPPTLSSLQLSTSMPVTSIPPTTTQSTTPPAPTTTPSTTTTPATTTTPIPTTTTQRLITTTLITTVPSKTAAPTEESRSEPTTPMGTKEQTDALFDDLKRSGKLINLNDEQRKNLQEIEKIEKEQAELLKQLTVLAKMFGGPNAKLPNMPKLSNQNPSKPVEDSLANRIISMAIEREKSRSSTSTAPTTTTQAPTTQSTSATTKRPNSIQDQLPVTDVDTATKRTTPSLEEILKQYNLNSLSTPSPLGTTYGKSEEALLAAILKDQGIGPTTPKSLADKVKEAGVFEENPTTKASKPKPKSRPQTNSVRPPGGRLMQGLNWLLDLLDPTTKRPVAKKNKPKTPAKKPNTEEELLSNQPTKITPVVTAVPPAKPNLSQEEIQVLIKQLEAVQNDPKAATQLDFSKIKSLQNLIDVNEGVQVTSAGQRGTTLRATARPAKLQATTEADDFVGFNKKVTTTVSTASVSNSIDDDFEFVSTTARTRVIPPVSLNPIPGIDDQGESLIRGNLLTAAVNVTRAISSFLGSALQDAAFQLRYVISNSANTLAAGSSSNGAKLASSVLNSSSSS